MGIFDIFKSNDANDRKSYLRELIKVAKADGYLDEKEYEFILKIGHKLSCSPDEIKALSEGVKLEDPSDASQSREHKLKLIFDLVVLMMIDGTIDSKELGLCKSVAMKSGFEPEVIDDIVHRISTLTQSGSSIEQASNEAYGIYYKA